MNKTKIKDMTIEERREYNRVKTNEWRLKNPQMNREHRKKYKQSDGGKKSNNKYQRKRYAINIEEILAYNRKYSYSNKTKPSQNQKEYQKEYQKIYQGDPKNKEKLKIRNITYVHMRPLLLKKYRCCQKCKSEDNLEIHHEEYVSNDLTKLKVLCRICHRKLHRKSENGGKK